MISGAITPPDLSKVLDKEALENIQKIVAQRQQAEYFNLGDEFLVPYGETTMPMRVVGFADATVQKDGEDVVVPAIQMEMKYCAAGSSDWATSGKVNYSASKLKTYIDGQVQTKFSSDFLACLGETRVQFCTRNGDTDVSYCKLFAPSMAELGVTDTAHNNVIQAAVEGPAFQYYQGAKDAKRIKQEVNATGTARSYWTRSLYSGTSNLFSYVYLSGAPDYDSCYSAYRVAAACNFIA